MEKKLDCFNITNIFKCDDDELLEYMISNCGYNVNNYYHGLFLPIETACFYQAIKCLRVLLKHGADSNAKKTYCNLFFYFEFSQNNLAYEMIQILFLYGLNHDAHEPRVKRIHDHKTRKLYYDWPILVTLYCLEKKNKFFLF